MKSSPKVEVTGVTSPQRSKRRVRSTSHGNTWRHFLWRSLLRSFPAPAGLAQHAWYFFAIFAGVIVGLMFEPLPGGAIGLIGVTVVTLLAPWVLYGPADLAKPGFNPTNAALTWTLSGFSNSTVWLIFGAFMFALGYEKTGLGRRIALLLVKAMGRKTLRWAKDRDDCGHAACAVHTFEHGAQRRHNLSCHQEFAAALRLETKRAVETPDRLIHHVGRPCHYLCDQYALF